jgi:hypothetical protein
MMSFMAGTGMAVAKKVDHVGEHHKLAYQRPPSVLAVEGKCPPELFSGVGPA